MFSLRVESSSTFVQLPMGKSAKFPAHVIGGKTQSVSSAHLSLSSAGTVSSVHSQHFTNTLQVTVQAVFSSPSRPNVAIAENIWRGSFVEPLVAGTTTFTPTGKSWDDFRYFVEYTFDPSSKKIVQIVSVWDEVGFYARLGLSPTAVLAALYGGGFPSTLSFE